MLLLLLLPLLPVPCKDHWRGRGSKVKKGYMHHEFKRGWKSTDRFPHTKTLTKGHIRFGHQASKGQELKHPSFPPLPCTCLITSIFVTEGPGNLHQQKYSFKYSTSSNGSYRTTVSERVVSMSLHTYGRCSREVIAWEWWPQWHEFEPPCRSCQFISYCWVA